MASNRNDPSYLGARLRERRRELALTQEALAALAGCSSRFVRAVEDGKTSVRLDKLVAVLEAVGLELRPVLRAHPRAP
jgi:y4mF family transcriptional regulator